MTQEEMRASSQRKHKQVHDLLLLLQCRFEAKDKVNPDGFIEKVIVFIDEEKYPQEATPVEVPNQLEIDKAVHDALNQG